MKESRNSWKILMMYTAVSSAAGHDVELPVQSKHRNILSTMYA